jgi:mRNA interferase RelE/StbE
MRQIAFSKAALRALQRMPPDHARWIRGKIVQFAEDPSSLANKVKKLQGRAGYRLRVGNWRVLFDDDGIVLAIIHIGPRGGIYD